MQQEQHEQMHRELSLSLLCTICDRKKNERVIAVLEGQKAYFDIVSFGMGTANSKMLNYLGLGQTEKAIFFAIMPATVADDMIKALNDALQLARPGHGIAFVSPIYGGCYHKPVTYAHPEGENLVENAKNADNDLIIVILNPGYTEEVMIEARAAGATGGTILHARGCGLAGAEKFFGVTIQPEKEVLMIVASSRSSCAIMAAIGEKAGPGSAVNAVSFSMPVTKVCGIGSDVPDNL